MLVAPKNMAYIDKMKLTSGKANCFHCLLSSGNTVTCLTWLIHW